MTVESSEQDAPKSFVLRDAMRDLDTSREAGLMPWGATVPKIPSSFDMLGGLVKQAEHVEELREKAARAHEQQMERVANGARQARAERRHEEAEQVAREERALDLAAKSLELAAKSHAEAVESKEETRRARRLAAWSLAVAVLALIAAVVVPLITG